ncbi:MAG: sigma-54-dependent transcriptional regulator [Oligoflexales bacterium]
MLRFLVVDDDDTLRLTLRSALEQEGHFVDTAEGGAQAIEMVEANNKYDVALLDVNMPGVSGLDALAKIKELRPEMVCLVLTAYTNIQDAVVAIKHGAYDYLEKPIDTESLLHTIDAAMKASTMVEVAAFSAPHLKIDDKRNMIGESNSIRKVFDLVYKLSKVETSVLIRGESGTGKELVARALHFNSHRKKGPFVAVNCGAIPENLIESELFGHEKGAFTGADKRKIGKFQFAQGGTIFLDEIGDITPAMQVKLLRVLQEKSFTPVGSNVEIKADVRVISATNRNLEKLIEDGTFRADLFYRLNILPIILPPLRDRREDIQALVKYLIKKFNKIHSKDMKDILPDALAALKTHSWPGNIRELENVIEHAFIIEPSDQIHIQSLPANFQRSGATASVATEDQGAFGDGLGSMDFGGPEDLNYPALKEKFEKEFIRRALKAFNGRINQTAEQTQMTKVTLLRKLEKYGINPKEYRNQV